jgi:hypothetical protein
LTACKSTAGGCNYPLVTPSTGRLYTQCRAFCITVDISIIIEDAYYVDVITIMHRPISVEMRHLLYGGVSGSSLDTLRGIFLHRIIAAHAMRHRVQLIKLNLFPFVSGQDLGVLYLEKRS